MLNRSVKFIEAQVTSGVALRIRASWDYWLFVTKRVWPLGAATTGVVIGAVAFGSTQLAFALSIIALIIALVVLVLDSRVARKQWSRHTSLATTPFPTGVKMPLGYEKAMRLHFEDRGTMLVDPCIDQALQADPMPVKLDPTPYRLPANLRDLAPVAIRTIRNGTRLIWDGPVLGLRDDPLPEVSGESRPLRLIRTSFFKQVCSAELCQYEINDHTTHHKIDVRSQELIDPSNRLVTLAASRLANVIGISTLAFTDDNYLLAVHQSPRNLASGKRYAPSGSGSLEPRDLDASHSGQDSTPSLVDVLKHGMERELHEETGIDAQDIRETQVVGFGRWLERGAKPEFFAMTRLRIRQADFTATKISSGERLFSEGVVPIFVDLPRLRQELADGVSIDEAPSFPPELLGSASLPLIVGLRAVALNGGERPDTTGQLAHYRKWRVSSLA